MGGTVHPVAIKVSIITSPWIIIQECHAFFFFLDHNARQPCITITIQGLWYNAGGTTHPIAIKVGIIQMPSLLKKAFNLTWLNICKFIETDCLWEFGYNFEETAVAALLSFLNEWTACLTGQSISHWQLAPGQSSPHGQLAPGQSISH